MESNAPSEATGSAGGDRIGTIMEIARAVGSTLHIDTLLQLVMEKVTHLMEADRSTLFILDQERDELWSKVLQGDDAREIRLPVGKGIAGWVAKEGKAVRLLDAYEDARFDATWDEAGGYRTHSLLAVPLRNSRDQVVAVVQCLNKKHGPFEDHDQHVLESIGGQIGVAIENAFLYEQLLERNRDLSSAEARLRQANSELEILYDVEQRSARARGMEDLVRTALQRVCEHLRARAAVILLDEDLMRMWSHQSDGLDLTERPVPAPLLHELLGRLHVPMRLEASHADALVEDIGATTGSVLSTPLAVHRHAIGVLQVVDHGLGEDADETALRLLALIGAQIAHSVSTLRTRQAEEQSQRLTLIGQAVAAILHDLRTPMTAIDGYAELVAETEDPEERKVCAQRIRRALVHMEALAGEVLDFARGDRDVLLGPVFMSEFVLEVEDLLRPEVESRGIQLVVEDQYRARARFDRDKMLRVVANLVRNACEAMGDEGGTLVWTISQQRGWILMDFADTGPGIPDEMQGRLFQFFSTHGKENGTGLGLAMSKRIVEAHGGRIECRESGPDGTTFRIEIPDYEGTPSARIRVGAP